MALVNPLLGTWDVNGVVRIFEYAGGNFVSIGVLGGFTHLVRADMTAKGARETPLLSWDTEDTQLVVIRTEIANRGKISVLDPLAEILDEDPIGAGNVTDEGFLFAAKLGADNYVVRTPANQASYRFDSNPLSSVPLQGIANGSTTPPRLDFFPAPNALRSIDYHGSGSARYRLFTRASEAASFAQTLNISDFSGFTPSMIVWASDSLNIVGVDPVANRAQSWRYDPVNNVWKYVHELAMASVGTVRRAVMSPDRRMFLISRKTAGGAYTTRVYKKTGDYYQPLQTLNDIGELLGFSSDGLLLVDAALKKCWVLEGETFVEQNSKVAALPAGIAQQSMSAPKSSEKAIGEIYTGGLESVIDGSVDYNDLKITLMSASAAFDATHTTKDQVTNSGAYEAVGGAWPVGGLPLQNVTISKTESYVSLKCDDVKHVVINTALSARRALIYQASTGEPLAFLDFLSDRIIARNKQLVLQFADTEFMRAVR